MPPDVVSSSRQPCPSDAPPSLQRTCVDQSSRHSKGAQEASRSLTTTIVGDDSRHRNMEATEDGIGVVGGVGSMRSRDNSSSGGGGRRSSSSSITSGSESHSLSTRRPSSSDLSREAGSTDVASASPPPASSLPSSAPLPSTPPLPLSSAPLPSLPSLSSPPTRPVPSSQAGPPGQASQASQAAQAPQASQALPVSQVVAIPSLSPAGPETPVRRVQTSSISLSHPLPPLPVAFPPAPAASAGASGPERRPSGTDTGTAPAAMSTRPARRSSAATRSQQPPAQVPQSQRPVTQEYSPPPWQPDAAVTYCPICKTMFSIFIRKHHCRKCGRVVCNSCSPHRITIPYAYIVQPPGTPLRTHDSGNLHGGERVRLCNPCVPDPNTSPPTPSAQPRSHLRAYSGSNAAYGYPGTLDAASGPRQPGSTPFAASSSPGFFLTSGGPFTALQQPFTNTYNGQSVVFGPGPPASFASLPPQAGRYHRLSLPAQAIDMPPASPNQPTAHQPAYPQQAQRRRPARPQISEEDECPVCHRELPKRYLPDSETLRQAHIMECIETHSHARGGTSRRTQASSPGSASAVAASSSATPSPSSLPSSSQTAVAEPPLPRPPVYTAMFPYRATEKDCVDDAECTICLEEFEVGVPMARLECFCRFHESCIRAWFVNHPGRCPVHQHDSFGY